ncbi:FAD-dependent oxidoreductase [Salicibibacter cibarius]|uniref:FAD-dependent oxidoreductase n=1 Tax=Salicibibacter cibarius TaxID=2743000 RepID=A0A7T6Z2F7_9BACI|nr:FAD-dependent oxidoreductase [Salicibibacter cibarius]QQK75721.1 FAD-dependent oxidoreductase [Salicibibacter cibarius]
MKTADAVVIGGGVIGTSIAYRLAEGNRKVILIEKGEIGSRTSGSCDKAIFLQSKKPGFPSELAKESRAVYENLEEELDFSFEFKRGGGMIVVQSEKYVPFMKDFVEKQKQAGIDIQLLDQKEARDRQPCLSKDIIGSTYSNEDAEVNPMLLSQAFAAAAKRKGVDIRTHTEVVDIVIDNGKVVGVQTPKEYIATEMVVNAAGPFAPQIGNMVGINIPIQPRRGVILISEKINPIIYGNILCSQYIAAKHMNQAEDAPAFGVGLSLGQTDAGNLLIGASREFEGFNKSVESEVLPAIAKHAASIVPSLGNVRIIRSMVGFRPYTGDGLPIVDEARDAEGFIIAAGHEGDGIALAPITGLLVRDLIDKKGDYPSFLEKLNLDRFK